MRVGASDLVAALQTMIRHRDARIARNSSLRAQKPICQSSACFAIAAFEHMVTASAAISPCWISSTVSN
jgi:hypothetical protein